MSSFSGTVIHNKKRGTSLGYPTANLDVIPQIDDGIYIAQVEYEDKTFPAIFFIGQAITFGEEKRNAEVYILDFNEDLYRKVIKGEVIKKIRENKKFDSAKELIEQMKKDEEETRKYFNL